MREGEVAAPGPAGQPRIPAYHTPYSEAGACPDSRNLIQSCLTETVRFIERQTKVVLFAPKSRSQQAPL